MQRIASKRCVSSAILFGFLLALPYIPCFSHVYAETVKGPILKRHLVPNSLLRWPEKASHHAILVDKSLQKVYVYHRDNLYAPMRTFVCSTGENDGPKLRQNDRKTPEGIYYFTSAYEKKYLSPIYGVRAFPIDYPNPIDKKEGKAGYGIWFHGTNKPLKPKDTNGCIVLENDDIEELASFIILGDTPVIISDKIEMVDPDTLKKQAKELEEIVQTWRSSWEEKEIDKYMSVYSSLFSSSGKNWQAWKRYKTHLARKYKEIEVDIKNLRILRNDGLVLAKFDQTYRTSSLQSRGEKSLFFRQNSKEWKIVGEFFEGTAIKRRYAKKQPVPTSEEVRKLIQSWERAWEQKDLSTYISLYDVRFRSRGMDLNAWKTHKQSLNNKYRSIRVDIGDLKIKQTSARMVTVSFTQSYRADEYRDFGLKRILLVKRGKDWKIKKEDWRALNRASRL